MIVPSIDIVGGRAVQLRAGEELLIDAGDPRPLLERFGIVGEVAVIDIDAARGDGDNREIIEELCSMARVRVGGGIRDVETARDWLDVGAAKVILGTAARPDLLTQLPRDRVMAAIDSIDLEVVSHGWRRQTGRTLIEVIEELSPYCSGLLVTFVEREGRLMGTDLNRARKVVEVAGPANVTVAGGVSTAEEVAELDRIGADAQVGMAIYTGQLPLADAFTAPLKSDREDGLWPTVVTDEHGVALGLAWSSPDSVREAIETRHGVYQSRSRGIWTKGTTSGAVQELLEVSADCDRDSLRFRVRQSGPGFCHDGTRSCWGDDRGLPRLARRLSQIREAPSPGSNTATLLADRGLLAAKLIEEAGELATADGAEEVTAEAADLVYFTLVRLISEGLSLEDIASTLDERELRVSQRPMQAKGFS